LYSSPDTRVCLITADPPASNPNAYKDLKDSDKFPKDLKPKIRKIIRYSRVAKKYKSYESRRQFLAEYDVFLADERIIHLLPVALGSTFYKSTTKRPIAVSLTGKERWGKKQKKSALDRLKPKRKGTADDGPAMIGKPEDVGHDIETALSTLVVNLSPSTSISIKVAYAGWPAEWITANVCAAVERVVTKYIPKQWDGLKALHLKGPDTAALPLFMAETIWDEDRVLDEGVKAASQNFPKKKGKKSKGKGKLIETEEVAQIEGGNSKKRKQKDMIAGEKSSKRTKVVVLEPLEEEDSEEAKRKRDAHQKLIDEVARKMKEADKQNEITKKKLQGDDRRRKEGRENHPDHVPFTITNRK
jgi:ribosome biogenesis protein UTP30